MKEHRERGTIKGMRKNINKTDDPKNDDFYKPIEDKIAFAKLPRSNFNYYEIRVWEYHKIINQKQFNTLKEAKKYYMEHFYRAELAGQIYVEITKIININTSYKI